MAKKSSKIPQFISEAIKKRNPYSHKGDFGRVLMVAGSKNMSGAAVLASKSALNAGSGLVYACVPEEISLILQISVPEIIIVPRESVYGQNGLEKYDAVAVGPGIDIGEEQRKIIYHIIENAKCPLVIDADGLNNLADPEGLGKLRKRAEVRRVTVITPHIGEARRLLAERLSTKLHRTLTDASDILMPAFDDLTRLEMAELLKEVTAATVVLKGHESIVLGRNSDDIYINGNGNPGMATAGSGDVLTGIITSFLGQKIAHAAETGVFIHGLAGDIAAGKYSEYSLTASDIADNISSAFIEITED